MHAERLWDQIEEVGVLDFSVCTNYFEGCMYVYTYTHIHAYT